MKIQSEIVDHLPLIGFVSARRQKAGHDVLDKFLALVHLERRTVIDPRDNGRLTPLFRFFQQDVQSQRKL